MPRATGIVATLGPASTEPDVLARLIGAGVDVVRSAILAQRAAGKPSRD